MFFDEFWADILMVLFAEVFVGEGVWEVVLEEGVGLYKGVSTLPGLLFIQIYKRSHQYFLKYRIIGSLIVYFAFIRSVWCIKFDPKINVSDLPHIQGSIPFQSSKYIQDGLRRTFAHSHITTIVLTPTITWTYLSCYRLSSSHSAQKST